ncbi:MAG TPA: hypothetical protein VHV75_06960 [Solirubrobacteraceae bacterium]|nr:hypothetical protein [Solirubrobacteraceae bacterium]
MADESSTAHLSAPEANLAAIASAQRVDRYLVGLASLADAEIDTVVGLVLNGAIVVGRIVSPEAMARAVDEHVLSLLKMNAASDDATAWEEAKNAVDGGHVKVVQEERQARQDMIARHRELYGDGRVSPTEMPEDLAREVIADGTRVAITLADANVFPPGTREPIDVGVMRVDIRQVGGWWIVPADPETRSAPFTFPGRS